VKYHSRKLSAMFRLQLNRVKAILILEYREAQAAREMAEAGPNWSEAYFEMEVTDSDEDAEIIDATETKADGAAKVAGAEAGEGEGATTGAAEGGVDEQDEGFLGSKQEDLESGRYQKMISISGQEIEDTITDFFKPNKVQWDPEFAPVVRKHADDRFVSEEDLALIKVLEKGKRARFWNKQEEEMRIEQERAREGNNKPFGAPHQPNTRTELLSAVKHEKKRYNMVLTDISGIKKGDFGIAVRDTNGTLREPTDTEFRWVRKREKHHKAFFRYKPYSPVEASASASN